MAVAQMVFAHYDVPRVDPRVIWSKSSMRPRGTFLPATTYQCNIAAITSALCAEDCRGCPTPPVDVRSMLEILARYPRVAGELTRRGIPGMTGRPRKGPLAHKDVTAEIAKGRPVIAIFRGETDRFVLIVGHESGDRLVVNDPVRSGSDPRGRTVVAQATAEKDDRWIMTITLLE